jgi:transcriptional regulator with XRE-family HTH domain
MEVKFWYNSYMETTIHIMGQKIRQLRIDKRLTLEQAAERAGCTPGFLSQIERNQAVPSITMLYAIAQALEVKVTYFFPRRISGAKVVKADEREMFRFEGSAIAYSILSTSFPERKLESMLVHLDPLDGTLPFDEFRSHPGEEFTYVLEGALRLWIGDSVYDLNPGDSIHFKSTIQHRMENPGDTPMSAFSVITPPVF